MTKAAAEQLRVLAAMLEEGDIPVLRFAAAGDETMVVITLRVREGGAELVQVINQPKASARQRMLRLNSGQGDLVLTIEPLEDK